MRQCCRCRPPRSLWVCIYVMRRCRCPVISTRHRSTTVAFAAAIVAPTIAILQRALSPVAKGPVLRERSSCELEVPLLAFQTMNLGALTHSAQDALELTTRL